MSDSVNHPSHYTQGSIECIDAMQSAFGTQAIQTYCQCNAFKYLWRANLKKASPEEDMQTARWYIDKWLQLQKGETE